MRCVVFILSLSLMSTCCLAEVEGGTPSEVTEAVRERILQLSSESARKPHFSMSGRLTQKGEGVFEVNGDIFHVNNDTIIHGTLREGARVEVRGPLEDGQAKIAYEVIIHSDATEDSVAAPAPIGDARDVGFLR